MPRGFASSALPLSVLLLALVPSPAAASSHVHLAYDVTDALEDSRAYPDVRLPQTDIARFTSRVEGNEVVQVVTVVGPWPENDYWVEVRNTFGSNEYLELKVERTDSAGSNSRPTDYATSFRQSTNAALVGSKVNFTFDRTEDALTLRWPASAIPADAKCFQPQVTTLSRTTVAGRDTQVDDELTIGPNACLNGEALTAGLDGTCPPAARAAVKPGKLEDARDDVGERENLGFKPHDNATLDVLALDTRVEDGWIIETITLAEPSPRDMIDLNLERQYEGNASEYERGAYLTVGLFETSASGSVIGEGSLKSFHVRAARVEPAGWELRYCASVVPEDAVCFAPVVRASMQNQRYQDTLRIVPDPCPTVDDEEEVPATGGQDAGEGGSGASGANEGSSDTPGFGALAVLACLATAALALRRRG